MTIKMIWKKVSVVIMYQSVSMNQGVSTENSAYGKH